MTITPGQQMPEPLITGLRVLLFASSPHVRKQCLPCSRLPPLWHQGSATLGGSALLDGTWQCALGNGRVKRRVGSKQKEDKLHDERHHVDSYVHPVVLRKVVFFLCVCAFLINEEEVKSFNN